MKKMRWLILTGLISVCLFLLIVSTPADQKQSDSPDRWLSVDHWVGNLSVDRKITKSLLAGRKIGIPDSSSSASLNVQLDLRERTSGDVSVVWRGTAEGRLRYEAAGELPSGEGEAWIQQSGQGAVSGNASLSINMRTGRYRLHIERFGTVPTRHREYAAAHGHVIVDLDEVAEVRLIEPLTVQRVSGRDIGSKGESLPETPQTGFMLSGSIHDQFSSPLGNETRSISWNLMPNLCGEGTEGVSLIIVHPAPDERLVFDQHVSGGFLSSAVAKATPEDMKDHVLWEIPEIPGTELSVDPPDSRGSALRFSYEGLPDANEEFGDRIIRATLPPYRECLNPEEQEVRFFFDRDSMGNPGQSKEPNWFFYWIQTSAGQGRDREIRYGGEHEKGAHGYFMKAFPDEITICDGARLSMRNPVTGVFSEGIDNFATTVLHEFEHKRIYDTYWRGFDAPWRYQGKRDDEYWEKHPDYLKEYNKVDGDGDGIPDVEERKYGLHPLLHDTHNIGYNDEEYLAFRAERVWQIGSADHEDWAAPGKQYSPGRSRSAAPGGPPGFRDAPPEDAPEKENTAETILQDPEAMLELLHDPEALCETVGRLPLVERLRLAGELQRLVVLPLSERIRFLVEMLRCEIRQPTTEILSSRTYLTPSDYARKQYTVILGSLASEEPGTLQAFMDESDETGQRVMLAWGYARDERAVPGLIRLLSDSPFGEVRADAAYLLGILNAHEAFSVLEKALDDPYVLEYVYRSRPVRLFRVREQALGALEMLGHTVERTAEGGYRVIRR